MGIIARLALPFSKYISRKLLKESNNAISIQENILKSLIKKAANTKFGTDHGFNSIKTYEDFKAAVPVRDYEALRTYIEAAYEGEKNVFWPGRPLYWAKTSGTTSGIKYIPISRNSISYHISSARNALLCYIAETGNANFLDGKLIFLSGSPVLNYHKKVAIGRLSGIVNHHIPAYLRKNQLPSLETNCVEDWEKKVDKIIEETEKQKMTLISGIPPWIQMYFDKLHNRHGELIKDIFPHFSLLVHGGVNFEPYRMKMEASIGKKIDSIETYPASEGFIAFQNSQEDNSLLLLCNNGIFYEFIPVDEFFSENPTRISLKDIELNKNYVLIMNTNAGLFAYNIGDTIKFVSKSPYKIMVTGRLKHYISAFGEHVISEEVEQALLSTAFQQNVKIVEFTVAPQVNPIEGGLPYHEWFIEFENLPFDVGTFSRKLDGEMQLKNIYYCDLIDGKILKTLKVRALKPGSFIDFMREEGKLGGQNKLPRLSNNREIADKLKKYFIK